MKAELLLSVLRNASLAEALNEQQWDDLIRQARRTNLLARLAHHLAETQAFSAIPEQIKAHLTSARQMAMRQDRAMRYEIDCIRLALRRLPRPIILLKGSAYLAAGTKNAQGRTFGDVDILVPKSQITATEQELTMHGWQSSVDNDYDQRYYRTWMHEIPPMEHKLRHTIIDVHHALLPPTARISIDMQPFFSGAIPLGDSGLHVLNPCDMVLHSSAHLFHEGEFNNALRDLMDLHLLFNQFGELENFWKDLVNRAHLTRLSRPLYYAVRYAQHFLGTKIPEETISALAPNGPQGVTGQLMDYCFREAFRPLENRQDRHMAFARFLLYLRSHWLRMPLTLLLKHLGRKAWFRLLPPESPVVNQK